MPAPTLEQIERVMSRATMLKGEAYFQQGRVREVAYDDVLEELTGTVVGNKEYFVRVTRHKGVLRSSCSCPLGGQCKHVVAAVECYHHLYREGRLAKSSKDLPHEISGWIQRLEQLSGEPFRVREDSKDRLFFALSAPESGRATVALIHQKLLQNGEWGQPKKITSDVIAHENFPSFMNEWERWMTRRISRHLRRGYGAGSEFFVDGEEAGQLVFELAEVGRLVLAEDVFKHVGIAPKIVAELRWEQDRHGIQSIKKILPTHLRLLEFGGSIAFDPVRQMLVKIESAYTPFLTQKLLESPQVTPEHAEMLRNRLVESFGESVPLPQVFGTVEIIEALPVPHLSLRWSPKDKTIPLLALTFSYNGEMAPPGYDDLRLQRGSGFVILPRRTEAEVDAQTALRTLGWSLVMEDWNLAQRLAAGSGDYFMDLSVKRSLTKFNKFIERAIPELTALGWQFEIEEGMGLIASEKVQWQLELVPGQNPDEVKIEAYIKAGNRKIDLIDLYNDFDPMNRMLMPTTRENRLIRLKNTVVEIDQSKLTILLKHLRELFGLGRDGNIPHEIPRAHLHLFCDFEGVSAKLKIPWKTTDELKSLSAKLSSFTEIKAASAPKCFLGELREYQREGLAWLKFLQEHEFAGILADDMGLGKTIQVIALLCGQKSKSPSLIVAPTSTLPNWRREIEKFAPHLKVRVLHGLKRHVGDHDDVDVVLTSYPLLSRDIGKHKSLNYNWVILDESQMIKNAKSQVAAAARSLQAKHRLCLTGTPIENNLEELWSQFDFLMPGFLGTIAEFRQKFRQPIEREANKTAQSRLSQIIRPFVLRRTKQEVATELPPKTEAIEFVGFGDQQADLYESLRLAMDERIRDLLKEQGIERSQIHILDALLKLRQACCDPRLLKTDSAREMRESAKLDRLIDMVSVLISEGRKILIFSQFTSMLDLIELRLKDLSIQWVRISGDTKDRAKPVDDFQAGKVPVFLISLKAGGTGLNLTAADTVIHYDPWWNPAVEQQATDRAYRIGQDKPVMVYKLVTEGTVEERILELQERKKQIAGAVIDSEGGLARALTQDDLKWLLSSAPKN